MLSLPIWCSTNLTCAEVWMLFLHFQFFHHRVPALCDFEPLNCHVSALHHLVQAAQSVDEMSQTITDLLSEQRVNASLTLGVGTIGPDSDYTPFLLFCVSSGRSPTVGALTDQPP